MGDTNKVEMFKKLVNLRNCAVFNCFDFLCFRVIDKTIFSFIFV